MKIRKIVCLVLAMILLASAFCSCKKEPETPERVETWTVPTGKFNEGKVVYTVDGDKVTATPTEGNSLGLDITDRTDLVSICYSMWFDNVLGRENGKEVSKQTTITEFLETGTFTQADGLVDAKGRKKNNVGKFYYWGEPAQGFYRSTNEEACRNNMTMLYNAGVDFIILDYTYITKATYSAFKDTYITGPMETLLTTIMKMRAEGLGTPYVVVWLNDDSYFKDFKRNYYNKDEYKDCFVYWNGKPLIMRWLALNINNDFYTVRAMQGLKGSSWSYQWSYLEKHNENAISYDEDDKPEQMCCCVAVQGDYMSNAATAQGRDGGKFWNSQWQEVFKVHPKIVTLTWWNEWVAQECQTADGDYAFTDNFNTEYSRDIEPMNGGHGDQYYQWMIQYIHDYKNNWDCPELYEK